MAVSAREAKRARYGEDTRVSAREEAQSHKSGFERTAVLVPEGISIFGVKGGMQYTMDIIPYVVPEGYGKESPGGNPYKEAGDIAASRVYFRHTGIGPNSNSYVCAALTANLPCPICEHRKQLLRDTGPNDKGGQKLIQDLKPKERQLFNLVDLASPDKGIQLWDFSFHNFGKQLNARITKSSEERGYEFYYDPDNGMSLEVGFDDVTIGSGKPFPQAASIDFLKRDPLSDELLVAALELDKLVIIPGLTRGEDNKVILTYEKLKDIYMQSGEDEEGEGEEESTKAPPTTGANRAKEAAAAKAAGTTAAPAKTPPATTGATKAAPATTPAKPATTPAKPATTPAKPATTATPAFTKGMDVVYQGHGPAQVIKVNENGTMTLMTHADDELHKDVPAAQVRPTKTAAPAAPTKAAPAKAPPAKPTPPPVETPPAADASEEDWGPDDGVDGAAPAAEAADGNWDEGWGGEEAT